MKKNVLILSALCFAAMTLVFSGCKKENNAPQEPAQSQSYKMSITATKGGADTDEANGPRRVISLGGDGTLTAAWENGDQVTVRNVTKSADLDGQLTAESDGVNTQLNGTLTGTVSVSDVLTLKYLSPNYADQTGTLEYISNNCDYATATVTVASVEGGAITANADAVFANQQAIVKFTLKNEDGSATIEAKPLVIEVAGGTYTVTPASATSEMYVALPGFASEDITFTATVGSDTYKKTVTSESLTNGEFYQITVKMAKQAPAYKEYGPFSVSLTQKVNFAQGNLKYTRSTNKFEFMTNQYDMVETNNQNVGTDYANQGVISLFGWATSNINTPKTNTNYLPTNTNTTYATYGSGITTANVNWSDNNNAFANYDWGANTGDLGTGWRTLTTAEWTYLFNTRTNASNLRTWATVNEVPGIILMPDGWTAKGVSLTIGTGFGTNDINTTNWATLEDQGCVFLPAAGYRGGTSVSSVGSNGYYWSSTSGDGTYAYYISFSGSNVNPAERHARSYGYPVRLVKNAN